VLEGADFGWRLVRFEAIDSTNEEGRRRALAGDPGRLWIVAGKQRVGRGRRGRTWISPKGNLHASALLIDPCTPALAPQLGFVAGVALAKAAEDVGAIGARLKWPNDLLCGARKCAGLLVEGAALPGRRLACVVGVGVNCASAPEGVGYPTAVLAGRDGRRVSADELFARLIVRFEETLTQWRAGAAFASIRSAWLDRAVGLGERIRITGASGPREGTFAGLDADGRLLFRGELGIETVEAADLWILPMPDGSPAAAASASLAGKAGLNDRR
jgi:BirA family biotin operon repressor/biotin-[acetyl-CoA-carboxylase] ligase